MKEPTLMSDSAILMIPTTLMSPVIRSLTSSPLRDLTDTTSPSTASMVPRTRDGEGGCCAVAANDDAATSAIAARGRKSVEPKNLERWASMNGSPNGHVPWHHYQSGLRLARIPLSNLR